ncbi:MAG: hypothetical protein V4805_05050 [Pseudomonadota bacterium]
MNQTNTARSAHLAGAIFDEVLVPLAQARRSDGAHDYFPRWHEANASSYFLPPSLSVMSLADFEMQGAGTPEELVERLTAYWVAQDEPALAGMATRLKEVADALGEEAANNDGNVSILCYTLF